MQVNFATTGVFPGFYTAQLSDANGSFVNPVTIGAGTNSPIYATIPATTPAGNGYRIRVKNSQPTTIGSDNGADLSINTCLLDYIILDTVAVGPYCDYTNYDLSVDFVTGGNAPPPYKVELSNVNGSFISPLTIGYGYVSPITAHIPSGVSASSNYKVRISSANLAVVSNDSPKYLTINVCLEAGIRGNGELAAFRYYPSQVENELTVLGSSKASFTARITDLTGRLILEQKVENGAGSIDVSTLSAQMYFITLSDEQQTVNGKFTKK